MVLSRMDSSVGWDRRSDGESSGELRTGTAPRNAAQMLDSDCSNGGGSSGTSSGADDSDGAGHAGYG